MNKNSNEEWYQRSFSKLHLSEDFGKRLEALPKDNGKEIKMNTSVHSFGRIAAAVAISVLAFGSAGFCYASDVGGIRTSVELWLNGEKQETVFEEAEDGSYNVLDENGNAVMGMGGVNILHDGTEIPLTPEELAESYNNEGRLEIDGNGSYIFKYKGVEIDAGWMITEDGKLYIHVDDPENPYTYFNFTDIDENGLSMNSDDKPLDGVTYCEIEIEPRGDEN